MTRYGAQAEKNASKSRLSKPSRALLKNLKNVAFIKDAFFGFGAFLSPNARLSLRNKEKRLNLHRAGVLNAG